jgi:hypothetical protein
MKKETHIQRFLRTGIIDFVHICSHDRVGGVNDMVPMKTRSEEIDRWGHDKFDPNQQGPKSR